MLSNMNPRCISEANLTLCILVLKQWNLTILTVVPLCLQQCLLMVVRWPDYVLVTWRHQKLTVRYILKYMNTYAYVTMYAHKMTCLLQSCIPCCPRQGFNKHRKHDISQNRCECCVTLIITRAATNSKNWEIYLSKPSTLIACGLEMHLALSEIHLISHLKCTMFFQQKLLPPLYRGWKILIPAQD